MRPNKLATKQVAGLFCILLALPAFSQALGNARLRVIGTVQLQGAPEFDEAIFADGNVVMSHAGAKSVDVFEPAKRRIIGHVTDVADPRGLAYDGANTTLYVASGSDNSVATVDAKTLKLSKRIPLPGAPQDVAYSPQLKTLFVSAAILPRLWMVSSDGTVSTVDVGGRIGGIIVDDASGRVFVSINDVNEVAVVSLNGGKGEVSQRWHLNASQPTGVAVDAQGTRLFVAVRYAVLSLNLNDGQEIARVPTAGGTDTLRYLAADKLLYAASTDGTITVIDCSKGTLTASFEIRSGVRGHSFALDPKTHMIYVPGGQEGRSKLAILKPYTMKLDDQDDDEPASKPQTGSAPQPGTQPTSPR